ncbi:MAG: MraY family glycosyltransferase [Anaerolineae bacterium]|nr:MraY family glycosyltransferase [Anaerolineae bacterium]
MRYWLPFAVALALSLLLTPLAARLSPRWRLVAIPGGRRHHKGEVSKFGGLPLFAAFIVGALLAYRLLPPPATEAGLQEARLLRGVLWGSVVMFFGGLIDDRWELPPWALFTLQFLAVAIAIYHKVFIQRFSVPGLADPVSIPMDDYLWAALLVYLLTTVWIVGMINTINFLDGLDGLAAGVGLIAALLFAWHGYNLEQTTVAAFPLVLAGALLGLLPFNFAPARIFLGSAGAYFLGYGLATMSILSPAKIATALLVLAVPILDVAWQIFDRLRRGQSPFRGDRGHLHFRLSDFGLPTRRIVLGYYAVALGFGLVAIFAPGAVAKAIALVLLSAAVLVIMWWLSRRRERPARTSEFLERQPKSDV